MGDGIDEIQYELGELDEHDFRIWSSNADWLAHVTDCPICGPIREGGERRERARAELSRAASLKGAATRAAVVADAGGRDTARILAARARRSEAVRAHAAYRGGDADRPN